jgi:uracil-DNA glycosylase
MRTTESSIQLEAGWKKHLLGEFTKPYMMELKSFLKAEYNKKKVIHPKGTEYFNAFNFTPFEKVKVVILGQDPYHGDNQAHGLCFSVPKTTGIPPSLVNIYKEIQSDLSLEKKFFGHGNLTCWAEQGVLLLNSVLTVEHGKAAAHQGKGWEQFTDFAIREISEHRKNVVFMLWGSYAHKKGEVINATNHLVLRSPHPSPLSAHRGFLGCRHFSKANEYLKKHGIKPVDWRVSVD